MRYGYSGTGFLEKIKEYFMDSKMLEVDRYVPRLLEEVPSGRDLLRRDVGKNEFEEAA